MCGISGIWHLNETQVSVHELEKFNRSLTHRGPDGEGYFIDEEKKTGLGHRRLKILDLSDSAKQPMVCCDERYYIIYNGEIYNFIELKKELKGYPFKTSSDTEVILAAYRKWGTSCLHKFNGMFAFAIWDRRNKNLFLARDRFGIKPLYILWIKNSLLAFASETIAFKYLEGYKRSVNEQNLASVLQDSFSLEGYGKTIFHDIQQLPAGHFCTFQKGDKELKFKRWWNTLDNFVKVPTDIEKQTEHFRELFFDSCKLRLRSDVPVATALSGGIDSSSVYSTIKYLSKKNFSEERLPNDWQTAFVATFPGADNDEKKFAEQVISAVNGKGIFTEPDNANIADRIISSTRLFDSVYNSIISPAVDVYKAMSDKGYKVSLDGHGVDEMLYGYPHTLVNAYSYFINEEQNFLAEEVKATYENLFLSHIAPPALTAKNKKFHVKAGLKTKMKKYVPQDVLDSYRNLRASVIKKGELSEKEKNNLNEISFHEKFYKGVQQLNELDKNIFSEFHLTTLPAILRNFDRASMQSGVEIRMPFMDWRIISFVFSLPFNSKVRNGYTKFVLRNAMKNIVPEEIRLRKTKIGFNAPMPQWFSNQLRSFIHDEVNSSSFSNFGIWNVNEIRKFVAEKEKAGWSWNDCHKFWPYFNAHLITRPD